MTLVALPDYVRSLLALAHVFPGRPRRNVGSTEAQEE